MLVPVQIPPGLERNNTAYETPGRWWDADGVRWQSGSMMPIGGNQRITNTALTGAVRKIHVWRDNSNARYVLVGTDTKLYTDYDGYTDITPSAFVALSSIGIVGGYGTDTYNLSTYGTARPSPSPIYSPYAYWTFDNWGEDVLCTADSDGRLFYYDASAATTTPAIITTAPTGLTAIIVTDERHVMATGYSGNARRLAWSSREDYTDWDFASTTNTAGFLDLNTHSPLLKPVGVREGTLVFSYTDVFLSQYVGLPYIYNATWLGNVEMMHPDSIAVFDGKAAWLSRTGFQIYAGGSVQPLECPILNDILEGMDTSYGPFRIHGSNNGVFPEIWWFYPSANQTECDRYVIWNWKENWWSWGALARSAMFPAGAYRYPYAGNSSGNMFEQENGWTDAGTTRVGNIWIESGTLAIGEGDRTMEINQSMVANGYGYSSLTQTFYSKMTPEGAERTFGPYSARSNGYTDTRVSGRDVRMRVSAATDTDWAFGKARLDVRAGSAR